VNNIADQKDYIHKKYLMILPVPSLNVSVIAPELWNVLGVWLVGLVFFRIGGGARGHPGTYAVVMDKYGPKQCTRYVALLELLTIL